MHPPDPADRHAERVEPHTALTDKRVAEHDVTEDEGWSDDPQWQRDLVVWLNAVDERGG